MNNSHHLGFLPVTVQPNGFIFVDTKQLNSWRKWISGKSVFNTPHFKGLKVVQAFEIDWFRLHWLPFGLFLTLKLHNVTSFFHYSCLESVVISLCGKTVLQTTTHNKRKSDVKNQFPIPFQTLGTSKKHTRRKLRWKKKRCLVREVKQKWKQPKMWFYCTYIVITKRHGLFEIGWVGLCD